MTANALENQAMTTREILLSARSLIESPENWCQWQLARDESGYPVEEDDPKACQWCAVGAVFKTQSLVRHHPVMELHRAARTLGYDSASKLNDNGGHKMVLRMFDIAISNQVAE